MSEYISVHVGEESAIKIKVEPSESHASDTESGFHDVGIRNTAEYAKAAINLTFKEVMNTVHHVACGFQEKLDVLAEKTTLDEASLDFGVKIDGKGNVYIGEVGLGTNFNVSLRWKIHKT